MRRFSEMDKHYDRHNQGICSVCGCTTARWKSICDSCRNEAVQEFIKKVELKRNKNENATRKCSICGIDMEPCDYSPLYGYSWVHPKTENDCKYKDGTLLFGGNKLKEGEETR